MTPSKLEHAARNNAIWCETICRSHGIPGEFHKGMWLNRHAVPRFYSNMVTLSSRDSAAQLAQLRALAAELKGPWSVKDSFSRLDLAPLGFRPLFQAAWLWCTPFQSPRSAGIPGLRWTRVGCEPELEEWESAWDQDPARPPAGGRPRLFLPALLDDPEIVLLAAYRGGSLAAGAIANHTDEVVGLSNVFVLDGEPAAFWPQFLERVHERFPGLPVVGYERGPDLALARQAGFESLEPLTVWTREP
jgi:hypothetical protein